MTDRRLYGICLIIMCSSAVAHGIRSHRWQVDSSVDGAIQCLRSLPPNVGDWISEAGELSDVELTTGEIAGYVKRVYRHATTGATVHVLLVTGDSGPIATHPPTACFSGRGYQLVHEPLRYRASSSAVFMQADFQNTAVESTEYTRVYWGWGTNGTWGAPDTPRLTFAAEPMLYKLYVSEQWFATNDQENEVGGGKLLMQELLPQLSDVLGARMESERPEALLVE